MKWHKQIALAGALAMLGGCAGQAPLAGSGAAPPPAEAFRLSPGDKVKIATFGEETLTGDFEVSPAGPIAFPLIGEVKAAGLQTEALSQAIEAKLGEGYLLEPQVSVQVASFPPASVPGEVTTPADNTHH